MKFDVTQDKAQVLNDWWNTSSQLCAPGKWPSNQCEFMCQM